jgi:hypothetical protein
LHCFSTPLSSSTAATIAHTSMMHTEATTINIASTSYNICFNSACNHDCYWQILCLQYPHLLTATTAAAICKHCVLLLLLLLVTLTLLVAPLLLLLVIYLLFQLIILGCLC